MNINHLVLAGNLTADADIVECQEKPGRFKIDFRMGVNQPRRNGDRGSSSELATFIGVRFFASERAAEFFATALYKGREVVVTGSFASHTSLGQQGTNSTYYFIDAKSVEVVPDANMGRVEDQVVNKPAEVLPKPEPRKLQVHRPGAETQQQHHHPSQSEYLQEPRRSLHPNSHATTQAQLYRDKGVVEQPVTEANAANLLRW